MMRSGEARSKKFSRTIRSKWATTSVLLVCDLFHPIQNLAVELLLNGDVRHCRSRRGAMPVLFARREPHDVAGANFFDRPSLALHPAASRRDDKGLAEKCLCHSVRAPGSNVTLAP